MLPLEKQCNKTHLSISQAEDREIVHRDYLAHCMRWSHVLKNVEIGETVLDLGCADAPLGMMLYANKFRPDRYVGVDIREGILETAKAKLSKANFPVELINVNLITEFNRVPKYDYTVITSFEMVEHIHQQFVEPLLKNISEIMSDKTTFFLSTPCFSGSKAGNHVYEWRYQELKDVLVKYFKVEANYGTFMRQAALKQVWTPEEMILFDKLHEYYDSNVLSIIFAPLHPEVASNCIWRLRKL
jgi:2-polyprenyl-3-methyl-5-hydroxy-6-metoxy-1,4-benzoquinol methylase